MRQIKIIYGQAETGPQKKAIEVLTGFLLEYTQQYPVCEKYSEHKENKDCFPIYIGTRDNNPFVAGGDPVPLTKAEEYRITVKNDTAIIEGFDDAGVLYGCVDFYNKYLVAIEFKPSTRLDIFDPFQILMPDFSYSSAPAVRNRGIWTWGHVIFDYKNFIDNMVKLKMNSLIIWNDFVPVNAKEMVEYAHSCAVKVIFGFAWGWDTGLDKKSRTFDFKRINDLSPGIVKTYEEQYADLGADGIYFQSITELESEYANGTLIAEAVTDFVNYTAGLLFEKYPDLELQFGLHATSVKDKLTYIKNVDPRIKIVWEDCGAFPFSYVPYDIEDFQQTLSLAESIAVLRGENDRFGIVTKGFTHLDWSAFTHLGGSVCINKALNTTKQNRISRKRKTWKYLQAYWLTNGDKVYTMLRTLGTLKGGELDVHALIEDGMFEEHIYFPAALYGEMLWDHSTELNTMINQVALRNYVDFA